MKGQRDDVCQLLDSLEIVTRHSTSANDLLDNTALILRQILTSVLSISGDSRSGWLITGWMNIQSYLWMLSDDIKRANHRFETIVLENAAWNISQEARIMKADFLYCICNNSEVKFDPFESHMRNFLLFQESWRNIAHFASEDPHRVVDFLQKEIDSAVDHQYRARCTRCLFYLVKIHDILPSSLTCMNIVKEGNHAVVAGGFSDIWKGRKANDGSPVCLKVLRIFVNNGVQNADTIISKFCREALVWRNVKHPNVLPFLGVNKELFAPSFCLISPWMDNGNIMSFLRHHPRLDRLNSITDVARGMAYLHSLEPPIVHADIRGANILITSDLRCCLADFGLALAVEPPSSSSCSNSVSGSLRWLAPEILDFHLFDPRYLAARDVYAFGCTTVEIFTGKPPYPHIHHDSAIIHEVLTKGNRPERPSLMPDELWKLVSQCFLTSADRRPLSSDLLYNLEELVSFPPG